MIEFVVAMWKECGSRKENFYCFGWKETSEIWESWFSRYWSRCALSCTDFETEFSSFPSFTCSERGKSFVSVNKKKNNLWKKKGPFSKICVIVWCGSLIKKSPTQTQCSQCSVCFSFFKIFKASSFNCFLVVKLLTLKNHLFWKFRDLGTCRIWRKKKRKWLKKVTYSWSETISSSSRSCSVRSASNLGSIRKVNDTTNQWVQYNEVKWVVLFLSANG